MATTEERSKGERFTPLLDGKIVIDYDKGRFIIVDDDGKKRIIIGFLPDGTIGDVTVHEGEDAEDVFA